MEKCRQGVKKTREANPCATLQQIGDKYGVTREWVRQILSQEGLPTAAIIEKHLIYCLNCGKETSTPKFCNLDCFSAYHHIEVVCSQCDKLFPLRRSTLIAHVKRNTSGLLFCSMRCQGKWASKNYGWGRKKKEV